MINTLEVKKTDARSAPAARVLAGLAVVLLLSLAAWWLTKQVYGQKELIFNISRESSRISAVGRADRAGGQPGSAAYRPA